jgi:hypothetical protein
MAIHKAYKGGYQIVTVDGKFHCQKDGVLLTEEYSGENAIYAKAENAEYFMECIVGDGEEDLFGSFENEVDIRREGGKSEYIDKLEAQKEARERKNAKPVATFVLDEKHEVGEFVWSGNLQYRVSEKPSYLSEKEADEIEDLDPNMRSGWYTKVELVNV